MINQVIPARCILCRQPSLNQSSLCDYCADDLEPFDYTRFDNLMLRPDIEKGIKRPRFERLISLAPYGWPWSQWITDMKFRENFAVAELMASRLATQLQQLITNNPALKPEIILPMPVHRNRRFVRGYNQSQLLAQVLADKLNIPLDEQALSRVKATRAQTQLNKSGRKTNLKNAFAFNSQIHSNSKTSGYQHIALVDDVITTGTTVNEACKILRHHGVTNISVWTVCATPLYRLSSSATSSQTSR